MTVMAKATEKKTTQAPVKKAAAPRSKAKATSSLSIDKISEQVIEKLQALNAEPQLQADIAWCLGSYRYDKNPVGLIQNCTTALSVLKSLKTKNAKAIPAKLITDLEKALKQA